MIKATIIEDDPEGKDYLLHVLTHHYPDVLVVGTADTVSEGVELLLNHPTDLLFLDVELIDGDGFDVLKSTQDLDFITVFTTGFQHYAIEAIRHAAFDYLLKPVMLTELAQTMKRLKQKLAQPMETLPPSNGFHPLDRERLLLSDGRRQRVVDLHDVLHLAAFDHYINVYLSDGSRIVVTGKLQDMEAHLPDLFFRVHRSHLIQLNAIAQIDHGRGGNLQLNNGQVIPVAYRKKAALKKRLRQLV